MKGQDPLAQLDVRILEDRSHGHGEGLAAALALVDARPRALALELRDGGIAATGAGRAVRPADLLQVVAGLLLGQFRKRGEGLFGLHAPILWAVAWYVKGIIPKCPAGQLG